MQAKAIGHVVETLVRIPASDCIDVVDGFSMKLEASKDMLRGAPFNMKFLIGMTPNGGKNVLELVHAVPTLDVSTGVGAFPTTGWRLIDGVMSGIPPCHIASLRMNDGFKTLHDKPAANVQVLVSIADTGDERGAVDKDGDQFAACQALLSFSSVLGSL